jgi:phosphotransferase system  glucose/maltose/N-acetylglucosamine-specific IIC component
MLIIVIWFGIAIAAERKARRLALAAVEQGCDPKVQKVIIIRKVAISVSWQLALLFGVGLLAGQSPSQQATAIAGFLIAWSLMLPIVIVGSLLEIARVKRNVASRALSAAKPR